ncbi:hypothetical protein A3SI_03580 [Nitritalea halalkaliphila LW7]|uniref:Uncharacterized protein n=1 Tax=Nitritalea halalkaliphila LW7 TaxID=1189621 RepID=I5C943_9BACT|nr:hypothetical protein [Nitritalea halalkaliphila]EIM78345.1 hypothetical protein A3SI_03580 [Nitritalea halalkaliphila LW7]
MKVLHIDANLSISQGEQHILIQSDAQEIGIAVRGPLTLPVSLPDIKTLWKLYASTRQQLDQKVTLVHNGRLLFDSHAAWWSPKNISFSFWMLKQKLFS